MSDNFNYSLVSTEEGNFAVRSTVKSFNLDHVTDKDIVSFYKNFSQYASFDTGLLPLDGTGVLAIRTAGSHTQIVTQHKPGLYYVNWGSHEGDRLAKTYYVAQPYRIVIGDFINGNLLGAKMFYSPIPITSPNNQLYHVNLPNINCKGYRGNAVGWICLYHNDDWSSLPFNEKVSRFIERCSGVETYNDANMSETDGPRFYASKSKPSYFYNPSEWQSKSESDGFEWTLDSELLIPVLVKDMDHQGQHDNNGVPLTLAMAMLGNYQAYYTDAEHTKMYNKISRSDMEVSNKDIASFVKASFAAAPVSYIHNSKDNPYSFTVAHREENGSATLDLNTLLKNLSSNDDEETQTWVCDCCDELFDFDDSSPLFDHHQNTVCHNCLDECYVYIKSTDTYFHQEDQNLSYSEHDDSWFHGKYDTVNYCDECGDCQAASGTGVDQTSQVSSKFMLNQDGDQICINCFNVMVEENELQTDNCFSCEKKVITSVGWNHIYPKLKTVSINFESIEDSSSKYVHFCNTCASKYVVCPCGLIKDSSEIANGSCTPTPIASFDESMSLTVNSCCSTCSGNITEDPSGELISYFTPLVPKFVEIVAKEKIYQNISYIDAYSIDDEPF